MLVRRFFQEAQPAQLTETVQSLLVPQRPDYVDQSLISDRAEQAEMKLAIAGQEAVDIALCCCQFDLVGQLLGPVDAGEIKRAVRCASRSGVPATSSARTARSKRAPKARGPGNPCCAPVRACVTREVEHRPRVLVWARPQASRPASGPSKPAQARISGDDARANQVAALVHEGSTAASACCRARGKPRSGFRLVHVWNSLAFVLSVWPGRRTDATGRGARLTSVLK